VIGRVCIACLLCAEAIALYTVAELIANGYAEDRHAVAGWALVAAVVLAYLLPRLAGSFFVSERNASIALTVAAVVILYALMRIEYSHDVAIWNFDWVADFLRTPADTFSHGSHAMIGFFFLLTAWLWGAYRSNNEIDRSSSSRFSLSSVPAPTAAVRSAAPQSRSTSSMYWRSSSRSFR
jgi:hypothetical protein